MIYLNNASTTKPDDYVLNDFMWCARNVWHNPSDITEEGMEAKEIIKNAQEQISYVIGSLPEEIVFTSGASEANNWAIKGFLDKNKEYKTIITTKIEHPSVYNTCQYMEKHGCKVMYVPVDKYGLVSPKRLEKLILDNEIVNPFVSIMFANNEIGTVQQIKDIAKVVHKYNGVFHVDAVQAFMHTDIDVAELGIDMMSVSFHKFGGFKNCGFLYIKDGIKLTPLIHGGHQFDSRRAGTENVPMIYAMGNQVERINDDLFVSAVRTKANYNTIVNGVLEACDDLCEVCLNGHPVKRLYNNVSFTFKGIDASKLISLLELREIYVSAGSACQSGENTPSRALKAIGLSNEEAFSTIRVSITDKTTLGEIDVFIRELVDCIKSLKMFG
jgi:cysteine desulfurase